MVGQERFDPRVVSLLKCPPGRWKKMMKVKVSCKRLSSYNYVQIVLLMFITDPLICVGGPVLVLTLGGVDDIRNWLVWLGKEDPRLCKVLCYLYVKIFVVCLLYTSPSPRDLSTSRMPSSA